MSDVKVIIDKETVNLGEWDWGVDDVLAGNGRPTIRDLVGTLAVHMAEIVFDEMTGKLQSQIEMNLRPGGEVECDMFESGLMVRRDVFAMLDDFIEAFREDEDYELLAKLRDKCSALIAARR